MTRLPLTIATTDYDHFRDIRTGAVQAEGIDLNWLLLGHHECFARMTANREFDLSEMSFAKFATQVTRQDSDLIGLPVICSRLFRFSSFYVNRKSGIERIEDLYGKTVGSPEWAHSAAVWMRGWMQNDLQMDLEKIRWVQAGANSAGREEKVELNLPAGIEDHADQGSVAVGDARGRRSRLRDHRAPADLLSRRSPGRGAALPRLSGP